MRKLLLGFMVVAFVACTPKAADKAGFVTEGDQTLSIIGFYNVENLFDTDDDPESTGDQEWLPTAPKQWTPKRYQEKLARLAKTINDLGSPASSGGPAILGVCEIENAKVLRDLIQHPPLSSSKYEIIHYESPDYRGIDCGLIYRSDLFTPTSSKPIRVKLQTRSDGSPGVTRDILLVSGELMGEPISVFVNHWPSRSGGETASRPGREIAAKILRDNVDSLLTLDPEAQIVIVGDFNDDPVSPSIEKTLMTVSKRGDVGQTGLYNPMVSMYRQGEGTLGYRDSWNLFDQVIVSEGLANPGSGWTFRNAGVMRQPYLIQAGGQFRGYPLRTYVGNDYRSGYSDHLPVYAVLTRPK